MVKNRYTLLTGLVCLALLITGCATGPSISQDPTKEYTSRQNFQTPGGPVENDFMHKTDAMRYFQICRCLSASWKIHSAADPRPDLG